MVKLCKFTKQAKHYNDRDELRFNTADSFNNYPFACLTTGAMASDSTPSKPGGSLSLYANLLDPPADSSAPGTISRAPVVFKQSSEEDAPSDESAAKKQQLNAGSFPTLAVTFYVP